jgi:hypothetical protein
MIHMEASSSGHDLHSLLFALPAPLTCLYLVLTCTIDVPFACVWCREVSASGHDLHSLLFAWLDELLFIYATEYIMFADIAITHLDLDTFSITATG